MIRWKINGICISSNLACSLLYIAATGCTDGYVTSGYYACGYVAKDAPTNCYAASGYVTTGYFACGESLYVIDGYVIGGYVA